LEWNSVWQPLVGRILIRRSNFWVWEG
jgi:hypothetical protein